MWFNCGSGGSPLRLNPLPHGFTPASLRCLCAMDPESLGKALQDCLRALSAGKFSEWKVLHVGLLSDPRGHMSLDEPGLAALFRIWATAGCGVARSASWFGADSVGRGGGHSAGHGPRFFFKAPVALRPGWFDESEVRAACWLWAPPSSTRRPRQAPQRQQRRQRQWHHRHLCSQVWFKRSKGCNRCAVVQLSFHPVQPCG